jgi:hypothetical protein
VNGARARHSNSSAADTLAIGACRRVFEAGLYLKCTRLAYTDYLVSARNAESESGTSRRCSRMRSTYSRCAQCVHDENITGNFTGCCIVGLLSMRSVYTTRTLLVILLGAVLSVYPRCAQCTRIEYYWQVHWALCRGPYCGAPRSHRGFLVDSSSVWRSGRVSQGLDSACLGVWVCICMWQIAS